MHFSPSRLMLQYDLIFFISLLTSYIPPLTSLFLLFFCTKFGQ